MRAVASSEHNVEVFFSPTLIQLERRQLCIEGVNILYTQRLLSTKAKVTRRHNQPQNHNICSQLFKCELQWE